MKNIRLLILKWIFTLTALLLWSAGSYAQNEFYDIYVYDVLKGTHKQVSSIAGSGEYNPSWSPNSKKIAHEAVSNVDWSQKMYITDVETGISTLLEGADQGNDAAWSHDGKKIMFDVWDNALMWSTIYSVPAEGGERTLMWDGGLMAEWSPNSKQIVLYDMNSWAMITVNLAKGTQSFLTYTGENPDWSPNGQFIAYDDWVYGGIWIIEVNPAGEPVGDPIQLTTSGNQPSWSNNSKTIYYSDIAPGATGWPADIYSIPVSGGTPVRVCGFEANDVFDFGDYDPCISRNGKYIAFPALTDPDMQPILQPISKSIPAAPEVGNKSGNQLDVIVRTKPGNAGFGLNFKTVSSELISLRVMDAQGRVLVVKSDLPANQTINVGKDFGKGAYFVEVRQGAQRKVIKLLKP